MKDDTFEKIGEKYKDGSSSLQEEKFLFNNARNTQPDIEAWSAFVRLNKTEVPKDFNEKLWNSFQNKRKKRSSLRIKTFLAAASVLLIMALSIGIPVQNKLSYNKKEALLTEARNMLTHSEPRSYSENIIYEDELIIIYTSKE